MDEATRTDEEWEEDMERLHFLGAFPVERWLMNRRRRAEGKAPLRDADILARP